MSQSLGRKKIWAILLALPVTVGGLLALGLYAPIPVVDVIASMLSGLFVYGLLAALVVAGLCLWLWRAHHTRVRTVLLAASAATLLVWIVVAIQSLALASAHGVAVDGGQLLTGFSVDNRGPDETVEYTRYGGQAVTLSVWRPANASGKAPVLVMTHGGGFAGGSVQEQMLPYARWLANQGFLVIGANYTLSSERVHAWNVAEGQIACALAWAGTHAAEYGGDASKVGMYGESAGGNLVINVAYKVASGALASSCGGDMPPVRAVSAVYPVVGIIEAYENRHGLGKTGRKFDEMYLGGTPRQYPERYAAVQSVNAITPKAPETLIVYGGSDHLVTPNGTRTFVRAAQAKGLTVRAIEIPYGEHGFDLVSGSVGAQIWRQRTVELFRRQLR